jgi:hypothetical protein
MPRILQPGLGWAPAVAHLGDDFSGSDGDSSEIGMRTADGLIAEWLVHHIDDQRQFQAGHDMFYQAQVFLSGVLDGIASNDGRPGLRYKYLVLLHTKCANTNEPYLGQNKHPLFRPVVLCGSQDRIAWHWIQMITVDTNIANVSHLGWRVLGLRDFTPEKLLLV